jgi:PEP-CTERM motif
VGAARQRCLWVVVVTMLSAPVADAAPILTLDPADAIAGEAGATIGWGFTLTNPDDGYLVVTSAGFCDAVISSPCSTPLGTFTDFIAQFNFIVVDPGSSVSALFDPFALTGIGSYIINSGASAGDFFLGQIALTYDLYAGGPGIDLISTDHLLTASASVGVVSTSPVPEPGTLMLLSSGLASAYLTRRRRRCSSVS